MITGIIESKKYSIVTTTPTEPDPLLSHLISYYKFNGDVVDSKGVFPGTAHNITYVTGVAGQAIKLNGTSSYVDLLTNSLVGGRTAFSVSFNFKMGAVKNSNMLVGAWGGSAAVYSIIIWISSGQLAFYTYGGSGQRGGNVFPMSDLNNHIVVATYDGATMKFYLDKILSGITYSQTGPIRASNETIKVGKLTSGNAFGNSAIDELGFWDKALNQEEVNYITDTINSGDSLI